MACDSNRIFLTEAVYVLGGEAAVGACITSARSVTCCHWDVASSFGG